MKSFAPRLALTALLAIPLAPAALGQAYVDSPGKIPQGDPDNNSWSEHVAFADVDIDGDFDSLFADGGECCNDQNRIWINLGGQQGGTVGFFVDRTSTRLPAINDNSRDIEFVDYDGDNDSDIYVTNTSQINNQTSRFWTNIGHAQGGALGFYVDETAARWVNVAENDGTTTFSSVAPSLKLVAGGFIDWSCDNSFADLDNDGDMDLAKATYGLLGSGNVPTRLFLNDGDGHFEEYNPSHFQLTGSDILTGTPGLWVQGTQLQETTDSSGQTCDIANISVSVDLADIDNDLDLDVVTGHLQMRQRIFRNNLEQNGGVLTSFTDVTHAAWPASYVPGGRKYEQELGDLDGDDDLDVYGTNWAMPCDLVFMNQGGITFSDPTVQPDSCVLNNEPDYVDYDDDGDLDVIIASDAGQEQLFVNQGTGTLVLDLNELPVDTTNSLGVDPADLDNDGDYDLMIANDEGKPNVCYENVLQAADTHAPRLAYLEQAPDRAAGPAPTVVRVHVYDNQPTYLSAFDPALLEITVDGSPQFSVPMRWSGGQVLRGEIPGALAGTIAYSARVTDKAGNTSVTAALSYIATSSCAAAPIVYCTSQVNSQGCTPAISAVGFPSASAGAGHFIQASNLIPGNLGLLFYSKTGPNNFPLLGGTLCVLPPTIRTPIQAATGSGTCGGNFSFDFNAWIATGFDPLLVPGQDVWAQIWSRDPPAAQGSNLTDGIRFTICDSVLGIRGGAKCPARAAVRIGSRGPCPHPPSSRDPQPCNPNSCTRAHSRR